MSITAKKILIIVTKGEIGGAQVSVLNLAKGLKEKGLEVTVGFGEGDFLKEKLQDAQVPFHIFKSLIRTNNPIKNLSFIFEIKKFLNKNKFDVVHFNSSNALLGAISAKLSGKKPKNYFIRMTVPQARGGIQTVFTFHGLSVLDPNYRTNFIFKYIYKLLFKFLLSFIDEKVFVSKTNLEHAQKKGLVKNGQVIYNGLDLKDSDFLPRDEARNFLFSKLNINPLFPSGESHGEGVVKDQRSKINDASDLNRMYVVGSIGRLAYPKNYEFLIKTFPDILKAKPNVICIIIGDGPDRNSLQLLADSLQLQDKFFLIGEIKDAYKYLKAFDLFVLPSIYEGLSISLIETLFAKIPALATNVGGNAEILGKDHVYSNKNEFIKKIKKSPEDHFQSQQFSLEQMTKKYIEIYAKN